MAIGSDTEIKQYQVQKRFSLADIALLGALGSLPFPAIYMPLRNIAGVKGTLKYASLTLTTSASTKHYWSI